MSTALSKAVREILAQSKVSWLELLVGGLIFIALAGRAALSAFFTTYGLNNELHEAIASLRNSIHDFTGVPMVASTITTMLWALVGLVIISLLWSMVVIIVDTHNDIVISQAFLHPHSFHRSKFWIAATARRLIAVALLSTVAVYIFLLIRGTPIIYDSVLSLFSYNTGMLRLTIPTALLALGTWLTGWHLTIIMHRLSLRLDKELAKVS